MQEVVRNVERESLHVQRRARVRAEHDRKRRDKRHKANGGELRPVQKTQADSSMAGTPAGRLK
jgi:hypothetical protein